MSVILKQPRLVTDLGTYSGLFPTGHGRVPNGAWLNLGSRMTVRAWIRCGGQRSNDRAIVGTADTGHSQGWLLYNQNKQNGFAYGVKTAGDGWVTISTPNMVQDMNRHFLIAKYDGVAKKLTLKLDNVIVATATVASGGAIVFGANGIQTMQTWDGLLQHDGYLDETDLLNRITSDTEDTAAWLAGSGVSFSTVAPSPFNWDAFVLSLGPTGYWKGDETSGTVLHDSSGNGRDMNLSGHYTLNQGSMMPSGLGSSVAWNHSSPDGGAAMPSNDTALDNLTKGTILIWNGGAVNGLLDWGIAKDGGTAGYGILFPSNNSITAYTRSGGTFTINAGYTGGANIWAALTWNGSNARLYLNGSLVASAIGSWPGVSATLTPMTIGTNSASSDNENNKFTRAAVFNYDVAPGDLTTLQGLA